MHIEKKYKWKPIRDKITSYYCCDAKASSNSHSPLIFCRLQPTRGYYLKFCKLQLAMKLQLPCIFYRLQPKGDSYLSQLQLDIYQATTWNGSTKSHVFSIGYNPQEAPNSTSSNWTSIKLQLDMETPTPLHYNKIICWFTWISALFSSFFTIVLPTFISSLNNLWIFTTSLSAPSSSSTL